MPLTVVKYKKATPAGKNAIPTAVVYRPKMQLSMQPQIIKRPFVKLELNNPSLSSTGIVLNKIPMSSTNVRPGIKRTLTTTTTITPPNTIQKSPKYSLPAKIVSAAGGASGSPSLQWQSSLSDIKKGQLGAAINSLPPNTIIKATTRSAINSTTSSTSSNNVTIGHQSASSSTAASSSASGNPVSSLVSPVRQAVFIKREIPQRSVRTVTMNLIDHNPLLHLGVLPERLPILKRTICRTANVTHMDCCLTLKKLRLNEPFAVLAEYFELSEADATEVFTRTLVRLARYLRHLIRWPDTKRFHERLKYVPLAYRRNLMHVQSLIDCVDTDLDSTLNLGCDSYKFIFCINTNGIISYISEAYCGDCDDLELFEAINFKQVIPKYLTLCSEPGKSVRRMRKDGTHKINITDTDSLTDSAEEDSVENCNKELSTSLSKYDAQRLSGELASMQSLSVVNGMLTSSRAKSLRVPTVNVREPACRSQMRDMIDSLRDFKLLGHSAIQQATLFSYINEMLVVGAALCNLQR